MKKLTSNSILGVILTLTCSGCGEDFVQDLFQPIFSEYKISERSFDRNYHKPIPPYRPICDPSTLSGSLNCHN